MTVSFSLYKYTLCVVDVSQMNDAYEYIYGGDKGSETTISDLRSRTIKKPRRLSGEPGKVYKKAKQQKETK